MPYIRPLGNRLVVKRWPEVEQHESGLWLPSDAREKPQLGDVLAIGPGLNHLSIDINLTDVVIFEKFVSNDYQFEIDGEQLLILPYSTIYCAVSEMPKTF